MLIYLSDNGGNVEQAMHRATTHRSILMAQQSLSIVIIDQSINLSAPISPPSNITFRGEGGSVISMADPQRNIFELYSGQQNVIIENLTLSGGRSAVSGFNCPHVTIRGCRIEESAFRCLDFGANATDLNIVGNVLSTAAGAVNGIFAEDNGDGLVIEGNDVTTRVTDLGIAVHTAAGTVRAPRVVDNRVTHDGPNFAIEVGQFNTGARVTGTEISRNKITLLRQCNGAVSLSEVDYGFVTANAVDLGQFAPLIIALEVAQGRFCAIRDNLVTNGAPNSRSVILDSSSDCMVSGNYLGGYVSINNSGTFPDVLTISRNQITANIVTIPDGSTVPEAFTLQINVDGGEAIANMLVGNTVSAPSGVAIGVLHSDKGMVAGTVIANNVLQTRSASSQSNVRYSAAPRRR
jgi:hypothetical protein